MPENKSESSIIRTSSRMKRPSYKVVKNNALESSLDSTTMQPRIEPSPAPNSATMQPRIEPSPAPNSATMQPRIEPSPAPNSATPLEQSEIKPESIDIDSLSQTQPNTSILEAHCTQTNVPQRAIRKRPFAEVLADIPLLESVIFEPLNTGPDREPQIRLPEDIDPDDPYALFSLFWPEDLWQIISRNTNQYAIQKRIGKQLPKSSRPWHDTSTTEIKIFIGILIYMGLHDSKRTDLYWKNDLESGPVHTPQLYMSLIRFEQIKRYLHISPINPLGDNIDEPIDLELASHISDIQMEKLW